MAEEQQDPNVIRLDGSRGLGINAHLTIITADRVMGIKETTYEIPFALIDFETLQKHLIGSFILGYRVEKIIPANQRSVVLTVTSDGIRSEYEGGGGQ